MEFPNSRMTRNKDLVRVVSFSESQNKLLKGSLDDIFKNLHILGMYLAMFFLLNTIYREDVFSVDTADFFLLSVQHSV